MPFSTHLPSSPTWRHAIVTLALMFPLAAPTMAADVGCDAKREHLTQQLAQAREQDQPHRAAGLQRALSAVNDDCTTASLIGDGREALADLEDEREEQREALEEAKRDDDREDIAKHQRKLDDLASEIVSEQRQLDALEMLPE